MIADLGGISLTKYKVEKGKIVRSNPICPRCGEGVSMADRGEWWSCGKCGTRWAKEQFGKDIS